MDRSADAGRCAGGGQTWRFVNKNGGPDRRFNNNIQLPIVLYGQLMVQSNGFQALVFTSAMLAALDLMAAMGELRTVSGLHGRTSAPVGRSLP